jgi:hypothetical protein
MLAGTMVAGGGGVSAAAASCLAVYGRVAVAGQAPGWRIVESSAPLSGRSGSLASSGSLTSVVSGPSSLWLFPGCGEALHYNGGGWQAVPLPAAAAAEITAAAASSPSEVWAFTSSGQVLFWNGRAWALTGSLTVLGGSTVSAAAAAGPDSVWAADSNILWYFNGKVWDRSVQPFDAGVLSVAPGGSPWAAGIAGGDPDTLTVVAHLAGGSWTVTPMARFLPGLASELCGPAVPAISAQGPDSVWAAGGSFCALNKGQFRAILHWTGGSWTTQAYHGDAGQAYSMAPDGAGGLWISTTLGWPGPGGMLRLAGGQIKSWRLPVMDGTSPVVTLDGAPGGDGPAFGVGYYTVKRGKEDLFGSVVIEQR